MSHSEIKNGLQKFREKRTAQNEKILGLDNLRVKRFFNVDSNTHKDGALDSKTKKLLGLVASAVLRCTHCIDYHLEQSIKRGLNKAEIIDVLNPTLIVGGSIVIELSNFYNPTHAPCGGYIGVFRKRQIF